MNLRFKLSENRLRSRIWLLSAQQLPGSSFQSRQKIGGHFADAFESLLLLAQFFLAEPPERLCFKTLKLFQHEPFEFIADFIDATTIHKPPFHTRACILRAFPGPANHCAPYPQEILRPNFRRALGGEL